MNDSSVKRLDEKMRQSRDRLVKHQSVSSHHMTELEQRQDAFNRPGTWLPWQRTLSAACRTLVASALRLVKRDRRNRVTHRQRGGLCK